MPQIRAGATALLVLAAALGGACKMTPEEIRVIEAENELLREQIHTLRDRCEQEREIEVRPEEP